MQYCPWPSIKAQVLADFILECTIPNGEGSRTARSSKKGENSRSNESSRGEEVDIGSDPKELCMLHVDGSSSAMRAGARLILTSPKGEMAGYTLRFDFPTTNNEAEYEALLFIFRVTKEVEIQHLKVFSDSQLVVGHIKGGYEARDENMKRYLQKVKDLNLTFLSFNIQQVLRMDNAKMDALSKLMALLPTDWKEKTYFEVLKISSLEEPLAIQQIDEEPCWIDPLLKYLSSDELPSDRREARKVKK
ncbi:uncharacterized protein [Elaeis guineensis]|uniref:uncharacterized protein n=1 Tax=Elaeis guineensis var. tenera TaxID=51953 RepID=UPI003C6D1CC2